MNEYYSIRPNPLDFLLRSDIMELHQKTESEEKCMSNVYAVVIGDYSDYHIVGIFSTEEKAQELIDRIKEKDKEYYDDPDCLIRASIETYVLDGLDMMGRNCNLYNLCMKRDGTIDGDVSLAGEYDIEDYIKGCTRIGSKYINSRYRPNTFMFTVPAMDKEHAVKIANEKRGALIMAGRWPTDKEVRTRGNDSN